MLIHHVKFGDTVRHVFGTAGQTGEQTDADSTPVVVVRQGGVSMAYAPTVTNKATGKYEVAIVCTAANGFREGASYSAYVTATVGGFTGRDGIASFFVRASSAILVGDSIYVCFGTAGAAGSAANADSLPTAAVLEQGTALAYAPVVSNVTTGLYEIAVALTAANGFEQNKEYTLSATATVSGITATDGMGSWLIRADWPTMTTVSTIAAIRDRCRVLIEALTPTLDTSVRFRSYRNEGPANFEDWAVKNATSSLRRFQCRAIGIEEPPEVSDALTDLRHFTVTVEVAYPQTGRHGPDQALDRDDVIDSDWGLINGKIGIYGRGNFNANDGNDCTPLGAEREISSSAGVDLMEIRARFSYWRTVT
jgi:hypothetical protein